MKDNQKLLDLIDKAGKGSIEAAEEIAVGYYKGTLGEKTSPKPRNGHPTLQSMAAQCARKYWSS